MAEFRTKIHSTCPHCGSYMELDVMAYGTWERGSRGSSVEPPSGAIFELDRVETLVGTRIDLTGTETDQVIQAAYEDNC